MASGETKMKWPDSVRMKHWEGIFRSILSGEKVPENEYRVAVFPHDREGRYWILLVWDGFDVMSSTSRQVWVWDRFKRIVPNIADRQEINMIRPYSAKEYITMEALSEHATPMPFDG